MASPDQYAGVQKRMRKGTKSCLPCKAAYDVVGPVHRWMSFADRFEALGRKRKIRCSGTDQNSSSCRECISRGVDCTAQGILSEDASVENQRLKAYIRELESRLEQQSPSSSPDEINHNALDRLLADVNTPAQRSEASHSNLVVNQPEEDLGSACAPLVRLLNNPALGTTLHPSQEEKDGQVLDNHRERISKSVSSARQDAVRDLCASLPPKAEFDDILDNQSSWWPLYRGTLGLVWGEEECESLRAFALQGLKAKHPSLLGILLTSLAISTGDLQRYLPAVERRIVNVDEYAGCEYGLGCLMALGLCYISSLQPRRAWTIYRRANALL